MKNFKQFLTEAVASTLYKPKTHTRYVYGWGASTDWVDCYNLPASTREYANAVEESGSIRLFLNRDGTMSMWHGGVLHVIASPQLKIGENEFLHLYYDKGNNFIYADRGDNVSENENLVEFIEKNRVRFQKSFNYIKRTFPHVNQLILDDNFEVSLTEPFEIKSK